MTSDQRARLLDNLLWVLDRDQYALERAADIFMSHLPNNNRATSDRDRSITKEIIKAWLSALPFTPALSRFLVGDTRCHGVEVREPPTIPRKAALEFAAEFRRRAGRNDISQVAPALACDLALLLEREAARHTPLSGEPNAPETP